MRYPILNIEALDAQQQEAYKKIALKQPNALEGPYGAILYAPVVASLVNELDVFLTESLLIPQRLQVIAQLTAAAKHRAEDVEKYIALREIGTEDISPETIDAIARGVHPVSAHEDENLVHQFVSELSKTGRVTNDCFEKCAKLLSREICLELVKITGFTLYFNAIASITQREPKI